MFAMLKIFFWFILISLINKQTLAISGEEITTKVSQWLTKEGINGTPDFSKNIHFKDCKNKIVKVSIPNLINNEDSPSLFVSYLRDYYISHDGLLRLTIDSNMSFGKLRIGNLIRDCTNFIKAESEILEIKYDLNSKNLKTIESLSTKYSLILSRFSKYCYGIKTCY